MTVIDLIIRLLEALARVGPWLMRLAGRLRRYDIDYTAYSGIWHGIHLTRQPSCDPTCVVLSHHRYDLKVTRDGVVSGSIEDAIGSATYTCGIRGSMTPHRLLLQVEGNDPVRFYKQEVFYAPLTRERLQGLISGFNYRQEIFEARILLLRTRPQAQDLAGWLSAEPPYKHGRDDLDSLIRAENDGRGAN